MTDPQPPDPEDEARERARQGPPWPPGERVLRLLYRTSGDRPKERAYIIAAALNLNGSVE